MLILLAAIVVQVYGRRPFAHGCESLAHVAAKMGVAGLSKCIALDMSRFKVRSNCIAPFANTRMTATIPADTEQNKARVALLQRLGAAKIAPFTVSLMADAASDVTGQVFAIRNNEVVLFTQHRPLRTTQKSDGWTPESCIVLMLDEDEAGRAARAEIIQRLAIDRFVKIARLSEDAWQPEQLRVEQLAQLIGSP